MLPPTTIPSRGTIVESDTPVSGSSSDTLPMSTPVFNSSRLVWSDRAFISSGVFAGKSMRFNLEVAQQPIHGRRKTEKDRRPLAHCPIVRLRIKECRKITDGTMRGHPDWEEGWEEEEIDVSTVESSNFICAADLFSPDETPTGSPIGSRRSSMNTGNPADSLAAERQSSTSSTASRTPRGSPDRPRRPPPAPLSTYPSRSVDGDITMGRTRSFLKKDADPGPMPPRADLAHGTRHSESSPNVMRNVHDAPAQLPDGLGDLQETLEDKEERRSVAFGRNLYGNSHVSGIRVPAPEGGVGLWFLFTDVTVKHEGTYTLRFRCFDITAVPPEGATPSQPLVIAYSQPFTVYSPRNFPGIPRPTELAEHFNRLGFKLNTRKVSEPSTSTAKAAAAHALRQNDRTIADPSPSSSSSDSTRRPSPKPLQHTERTPSSLGRYSTSAAQNNTSSSTDIGSGSWSSATDTGTMTAPSSTGGSGGLSAGSGGLAGSGGIVAPVAVAGSLAGSAGLAAAAGILAPGVVPGNGGAGPSNTGRTQRQSSQHSTSHGQ